MVIGNDLGNNITEFIKSEEFSQIVIFTQEKVEKASNLLINQLQEQFNARIFLLDDGEESKNISNAINSISKLAQLKADKKTLLIAYGGGTVSDHVGFVSSIFKRGIKYINIPTTLTGMIDASIGGKTALNIGGIKNQIGTFYQPAKIFINLDYIDIMPSTLIRDGLGEMFKYTLLSKNQMITRFINYLNTNDVDILNDMIRECCNMKIKIVHQDEKDQNIRKILNLGHTFGHAIESESNNKVPHGIAVINGILMATFLSWKKGYLKKEKFEQITHLGEKIISGKYIIQDVDKYVNIMLDDKKNFNREIGVIIIKDIGDVELQYFTFDKICIITEEYNEYISH